MSSNFKLPRNFLNILTHISLWVVFLGVPIFFDPPKQPSIENWANLPPTEVRYLVSITANLCLVFIFYLNFSLLLPRVYLRGKTLRYFLLILVTYAVFQIIVVLLRGIIFSYLPPAIDTTEIVRISHGISSGFFLLIWAASSGFRLGEEWRRTDKSRIEAELILLKSQINPHFLLNSLNNLYALALTNPVKTPDAILKLSEMVAYILYDCNKPKVALSQDLNFIENYIALQRLRMPPNAVLRVDIQVSGTMEAYIEPMILISFIENAFKHGLTTKHPCEIGIFIKVSERQLYLEVENQVLPAKMAQNGQVSGIGLSNTIQRLDHNYPGRHTLNIENDGIKHIVKLEISL